MYTGGSACTCNGSSAGSGHATHASVPGLLGGLVSPSSQQRQQRRLDMQHRCTCSSPGKEQSMCGYDCHRRPGSTPPVCRSCRHCCDALAPSTASCGATVRTGCKLLPCVVRLPRVDSVPRPPTARGCFATLATIMMARAQRSSNYEQAAHVQGQSQLPIGHRQSTRILSLLTWQFPGSAHVLKPPFWSFLRDTVSIQQPLSCGYISAEHERTAALVISVERAAQRCVAVALLESSSPSNRS